MWYIDASFFTLVFQHIDACDIEDATEIMGALFDEPFCIPIDTPVHNSLCLRTTTGEEVKILVLTNTNKYSSSDMTYSFSNQPTEFGTGNCATHHICSEINIFVNMQPDPRIGVIGVAGSTMASSIGTIKFKIIDKQGIKQIITLDDIIHLPESTKI